MVVTPSGLPGPSQARARWEAAQPNGGSRPAAVNRNACLISARGDQSKVVNLGVVTIGGVDNTGLFVLGEDASARPTLS